MSTKLRFIEKIADKIVIGIFNKPVDNAPRKIQVQSLLCCENIPDLDRSKAEFFTPGVLSA